MALNVTELTVLLSDSGATGAVGTPGTVMLLGGDQALFSGTLAL